MSGAFGHRVAGHPLSMVGLEPAIAKVVEQVVRELVQREATSLFQPGSLPVTALRGSGSVNDLVVTTADGAEWQPPAAAAPDQVVTVNSTTTLTASDQIALVTANVVVSLPAVHTSGQQHVVKDAAGIAASTPIVVSGNGSTIDGQATDSLTTNWQSTTYVSNGTDWSRI